MTTATELRELTDEELLNRLAEAKQDVFTLRFKLATGSADNHTLLGGAKRDVARILTVLRQREIAAAESAGAS
jgi:large subunit ribosomal protein L29